MQHNFADIFRGTMIPYFTLMIALSRFQNKNMTYYECEAFIIQWLDIRASRLVYNRNMYVL